MFFLGFLIPVQIPYNTAEICKVGSEGTVRLTKLADFPVGGTDPIGVIECLAMQVEQSVQGVKLDSSGGFRDMRANKVESRSGKSVESVTETGIVIRIAVGLSC